MSELPKAVEVVVKAVERISSARGLRKARWRVYYTLTEMGWSVQVNEARPSPESRIYLHPKLPGVVTTSPVETGIEFGKIRPGRRNLERLERASGVKMLVLIWSRGLEPWRDTRSEWNRVELEAIPEDVFIISAAAKPPAVHTRASLELDYQRWVETTSQLEEQRDRELEQLILETVAAAWSARQPVSVDAKAGPARHLPQLMAKQGFDAKVTRAKVKELISGGRIELGKHPYTWLRGLRTTDKMSSTK